MPLKYYPAKIIQVFQKLSKSKCITGPTKQLRANSHRLQLVHLHRIAVNAAIIEILCEFDYYSEDRY